MKLQCRFWKDSLLRILFLVLSYAIPGSAQNALSHTKLQVSEAPEATKYWKVLAADLVQEFDATTGSLKLENNSDQILDNVALYAEYYDAVGRLSFSLVFSQATNLGDDQTPIAPGMSRTLYSKARGMIPASTPTQVRTYVVGQTALNQNPAPNDMVSLKIPATLGGSLPSDFESLQLPAPLILAKGPVLDLLLAKLSIDERGKVAESHVLHSADPEIESWFNAFVRVLNFYPATLNSVPIASDALISVQAVVSKGVTSESYVAPWIRAYAASSADNEIPPATRIVFGLPAETIQSGSNSEYVARPPAPAGKLEIWNVGSDWSVTAYKWVKDESMPRHLARQLASKQSPK